MIITKKLPKYNSNKNITCAPTLKRAETLPLVASMCKAKIQSLSHVSKRKVFLNWRKKGGKKMDKMREGQEKAEKEKRKELNWLLS